MYKYTQRNYFIWQSASLFPQAVWRGDGHRNARRYLNLLLLVGQHVLCLCIVVDAKCLHTTNKEGVENSFLLFADTRRI
jgi:hypothetical protein